MTYQESRNIVYLICTLGILGYYSLFIIDLNPGEAVDTHATLASWAKTLLILIPIQIGVNIVATILFHIGYAIVNKQELKDVTDERDKLIDLKATRNSFYTFMVGFVISLVTLALEMSPLIMFNVLIFALLGSQLVGFVSMFCYYRRGV